MDLSQTKLSKIEWNMIEIPVSAEEKQILQLIIDGYENPTICRNKTETMLSFIKISYSENMEKTLYKHFFEKEIAAILKKYGGGGGGEGGGGAGAEAPLKMPVCDNESGGVIRRANSIRMENISDNINSNKENIFEFIQIEFCKKILKYLGGSGADKKYAYYLYTLIHTNKSKILYKNKFVQEFVADVIKYTLSISGQLYNHILENAQNFIEKNKYIFQFADLELYEHQRKLFSIFRAGAAQPPPARLVLYLAPTGTGKTMSPLGLSQKYRVIFVCVARHVGLALAKSAISMGKSIAFAFGCETAGDIRLHYFAAKEYTKNRRSGMIQKVDNSVGDKVEIMICDIKSYLCAMNYMMAFNPIDEIITYWDEPTITLDVPDHELHATIARNWRENLIPNIVLSCATLPREEEIMDVIGDFRGRFSGEVEIHTISSYDTKKSVALINKNGYVVTPHTIYEDYSQILKAIEHIENTPALMKYLDLKEIAAFLVYVDGKVALRRGLKINEYFESVGEITMSSIKEYYLKVLRNIPGDKWGEIYNYMKNSSTRKIGGGGGAGGAQMNKNASFDNSRTEPLHKVTDSVRSYVVANTSISNFNVSRRPAGGAPINKHISFDSGLAAAAAAAPPSAAGTGVYLTTADAHTLTDGPTIYLAEDVNKIARFYLQQSNIPELILTRISATIEHNNKIQYSIDKLQRDIEDATARDADKENKMTHDYRLPPAVQQMMGELNQLRRRMQYISLDSIYIPNSLDHQNKWVGKISSAAFMSDIDEQVVAEISALTNVANSWKILLLMGIGVFMQHESTEYIEIMKKLAYEQKLYMIIASSDYIYGTNYQFCHGVLGKDLMNLTQQKTIQAMGRIGRNHIQQDYSVRFRDDEIYMNLFQPAKTENIEAINMNRLFVSV
jgi:hypothetical protein